MGLARWQLIRVLEFLEAHLTEDIGLDELAQMVGLSQSQFARAFKASTGLPPYKWCLHNRIKRAQEMLLNGNDSLSEIALENGFADQSHFTKTFRRVTGTTPATWKRQAAIDPPNGQLCTQQQPSAMSRLRFSIGNASVALVIGRSPVS